MHAVSNQPDRSCPTCRLPLQRRDDLWHCPQHGDFFSYGPRRLMHVAAEPGEAAPLLPWQTVAEVADEQSPLPAPAAATK